MIIIVGASRAQHYYVCVCVLPWIGMDCLQNADVSSGSGDSSSGSGDFPDPEGSGIPFVVVPAHMVRNANTGGRADPHDAIICTVPLDARLPEVARELHVSVSLNGQQYTSRSEYPLWWQPSTVSLRRQIS